MKSLKLSLVIIIIGLITLGIILYLNLKEIEGHLLASLFQLEVLKQKENLNEFAKCLSQRGVKLYGISGETLTQNQRVVFGEAAKHLLYIECIEPETKQLTFKCQVAEIKAFPTWEFPDGKRKIGETSFKELEELSGCSLY